MNKSLKGLPDGQGLYTPQFEHDACGIGFVVNIEGRRSHEIVTQALTVLKNLAHRGGAGSESNTGDGAGILMQIPDKFLRLVCPGLGINLPPEGQYGVGMVFLPRDIFQRRQCEQQINDIVQSEGLKVLGWRSIPVNDSELGQVARDNRPEIRQLFIGNSSEKQDENLHFERKLFIVRKLCEHYTFKLSEKDDNYFYFASLSSRTIVYKGMLTASQVSAFYLDLNRMEVETALALVHSRYSTNTFPSWERAHPYRYLIHNGEINTLRGNVNWMHARQASISSELFGKDIAKIFPLLNTSGSDSAIFDNCLEFLALSGRSLPHAAMMMVPEPWHNNESMSPEKKAFYAYHSHLMEPWDGPAAMAFTDGVQVGAILDRNGLRPSRYTVTKDGLVILASETGVLDIAPENILRRERLRPGRMLLIDTSARRIITDDEVKNKIVLSSPWQYWLEQNLLDISDLPDVGFSEPLEASDILYLEKLHGYSYEDLKNVLLPMSCDAVEPLGSMGTDTPLAVLSTKPQLLYNYFKQLFAQVTNPPIDSLRESVVTATEISIGSEGNLIDPRPQNCRRIRLNSPLIGNADLARLKQLGIDGFSPIVLSTNYIAGQGGDNLASALDLLCGAADRAIAAGVNIIVLSDRNPGPEQAPIPILLAVSGLHHHLVRQKTRTRASIIVESAEPREVHHFALLVGYGASAVNPYLALAAICDMIHSGLLRDIETAKAQYNYLHASVKGLVKTIAKMGISTVQSYQGAQVFEAVGLNRDLVDRYFTATASRIGGIGLEEIDREVYMRYADASDPQNLNQGLDSGSYYHWRSNGEEHLFNPHSVYTLQQAVRTNDLTEFRNYSRLMNQDSRRQNTLRGLLEFNPVCDPVPLAEVEPVESIVKRFKTGAMSYGSISKEAHETLAIAMNRLGGKSNTGEGGEDPQRFLRSSDGDSLCSAIKQIASGRFGVTSEYLVSARELQIKMAQGAKPGEGGQLPGKKVYPWIAATRHSTPGVGLISPPPHHDIYSIEDLAELIHDLKNANSRARVSVKLVSEAGVGTIAAGVAKGRADVILISGYDGGTGASPLSSIRHAGLPWELGLAETHQTLLLNDLRSRVTLETDGKLLTGRDVAVAALLGAEEFGFATGPLIALGCIMMRVCNLDTCPVGVATQNPRLRTCFQGKPEYVERFMCFIATELREIMARLGFRTIEQMVGRTDCLVQAKALNCWKSSGLDLSALLYQPPVEAHIGKYCREVQNHRLEDTYDQKVLLPMCLQALENGQKIEATLPIRNINRATATQLGSEITRRYGADGLPDNTIRVNFIGSAGQSFAAFVPRGLTLSIEGDANDYLGKGLCGGKVIVRPDRRATFAAEDNVIIGNVAFYGATSGEAYIRGAAGERFCVRNSGINAVVESVGDHGCEYMTGGRVVVLGSTGRNFAAGMSGGIAYVFDADGRFSARCNQEMVEIVSLGSRAEIAEIKAMIQRHVDYTGSTYAAAMLANWPDILPRFRKVLPRDYKRMLEALDKVKEQGLSGDEAMMAAFNVNNQDLARVSGN